MPGAVTPFLASGACAILAASVAGIGMTTASRAVATPARTLSSLAVSTDDRPSQAEVDAAPPPSGLPRPPPRACPGPTTPRPSSCPARGRHGRAAGRRRPQAQLDGRNRELSRPVPPQRWPAGNGNQLVAPGMLPSSGGTRGPATYRPCSTRVGHRRSLTWPRPSSTSAHGDRRRSSRPPTRPHTCC